MATAPTNMQALHEAWYFGNREEFDEVVRRRPPGAAEVDQNGRTGLWLSAATGSELGVEYFLRAGADVDFASPIGETPLHAAVFWRNAGCARMLLAAHANVDARDKHGQTPLMFASLGGSLDLAELLLANGARLDVTDVHRRSALMMAVGRRRNAIVRKLLSVGANTNLQDENGMTALMVAPNAELFSLLLEHGADAGLRDHSGLTVQDHMRRRPKILAILEAREGG